MNRMSRPSLTQHPSIADVPEKNLVRRIREDWYAWDALINIKGLPDKPTVHLEVPLDGAPGQPKGDIDILLHELGAPALATAIEVKRIKVSTKAFEAGGSPNGRPGFEEGVVQANRRAEMGFHQVYLYVLVVVDARENNLRRHGSGEITYDGLTPDLRTKIRNAISLQSLRPGVGLVVHEFIQSMDNTMSLGDSGGAHRWTLGTAAPDPQPADPTAWIAGLR
jgi:hypothetical protein